MAPPFTEDLVGGRIAKASMKKVTGGACINLFDWHAAGKGFRKAICKIESLRKAQPRGRKLLLAICGIISGIPSIPMIL